MRDLFLRVLSCPGPSLGSFATYVGIHYMVKTYTALKDVRELNINRLLDTLHTAFGMSRMIL